MIKEETWVCTHCKFLGLIGNWGTCSNQERFKSGNFMRLEEANETMALADKFSSCSYLEVGSNGIFDKEVKNG